MANYAPNYTTRYRIRYQVIGQVHTATMRIAREDPTPAATGAAWFTDLFDVFGTQLSSDFVLLGADLAMADSDIFLPASVLPVVNDLSAALGDESFKPLYVSFTGRSTSGERAVMFLYGYVNSPTAADNTANDYRVYSTENSAVLQAVSVFNGVTGAHPVANDNNQAVWNPYINIGFNSYYQRKARRG